MKIIGTRKWTAIILGLITAGLVVWDVFMVVTPTRGDTISELILSWAHQNPTLPFAFGCLMGHLFWPQVVEKEGKDGK